MTAFTEMVLHGTMLSILLFSISVTATAIDGQHDDVKNDMMQLSDREIMKQLVSEIQQLKTDCDHDRQIISDLLLEINDLKKDNAINKERIRELERKMATPNDEMTAMRHTIASTASGKTDTVMPQNRTASSVNSRNAIKDAITKSLPRKVRKTRRQISGQPVAFSSYLKPGMVDHLGAHQNIVFDQTLLNSGNVYNVHHGVFTVPVSGVYVITASVLSAPNREVWCEIVVNGVKKVHIYARGTDGRHDQGSQTILVQLSKGDDVSVQNLSADDAVWGDLYTTFSGFLLFEDEATQILG